MQRMIPTIENYSGYKSHRYAHPYLVVETTNDTILMTDMGDGIIEVSFVGGDWELLSVPQTLALFVD